MPTPKNKAKHKPRPRPAATAETFPNGDVLTLAEAAEYLRITEDEVVRLTRDQGLPGRKLGDDWRFLKMALQDWLRAPPGKKEGLLIQIGAFEDDPDLGEMLERIHQQRGRRAPKRADVLPGHGHVNVGTRRACSYQRSTPSGGSQ